MYYAFPRASWRNLATKEGDTGKLFFMLPDAISHVFHKLVIKCCSTCANLHITRFPVYVIWSMALVGIAVSIVSAIARQKWLWSQEKQNYSPSYLS